MSNIEVEYDVMEALDVAFENGVSVAKVEEMTRLLDGQPSDFAVELNKVWLEKRAELYKDGNNIINDKVIGIYRHDRIVDILHKVCDHYDVDLINDVKDPDNEMFTISVSYIEVNGKATSSISNIPYEITKDIYRDLMYLSLYPTIFYNNSGEINSVRYKSLGEFITNDAIAFGIETEQSVVDKLKSLGYDDNKVKKDWIREYYNLSEDMVSVYTDWYECKPVAYSEKTISIPYGSITLTIALYRSAFGNNEDAGYNLHIFSEDNLIFSEDCRTLSDSILIDDLKVLAMDVYDEWVYKQSKDK